MSATERRRLAAHAKQRRLKVATAARVFLVEHLTELEDRAELGAVLELGKVLFEENPCGGGDLEPPLLSVRGKAPALRRRHLHAQRANAFAPDSGFHYHALYHGRRLRAVTIKKKPSTSATGVPSSARRNE